MCDWFELTTVIASVPSWSFTIVISSSKPPAVAVNVTAVLEPNWAGVIVAVSPLPPTVIDGLDEYVVELPIFCLLAVSVMVDGVIVPSCATLNIWVSADNLSDFADKFDSSQYVVYEEPTPGSSLPTPLTWAKIHSQLIVSLETISPTLNENPLGAESHNPKFLDSTTPSAVCLIAPFINKVSPSHANWLYVPLLASLVSESIPVVPLEPLSLLIPMNTPSCPYPWTPVCPTAI